MAHYAFLDDENFVTEVIVGKDENENDVNWEEFYSQEKNQICKRTSYNTIGGIHTSGGVPFRKNYAGLGFFYDLEKDAFIPPKCHETAVLNDFSCRWECDDESHSETF